MKKIITTFFVLFIYNFSIIAQSNLQLDMNKCNLKNNFLEKIKVQNPTLYENFLKEQVALSLSENQNKTTTTYTIPVVFYLFDNGSSWTNSAGTFYMSDISDDIIFDALDHLNSLFTTDKQLLDFDPLIQFCLATKVDGEDLTTTNAVIAPSTVLTYNGGASSVTVGPVDQADDNGNREISNPGIFRIELPPTFFPIGPDDTPDPLSTWVPMTTMMLLDETDVLRIAIGPNSHGSATIPFTAFGWYGTGDMGIYVNAGSFGSPVNCNHCDDGQIYGYTFAHEIAHYLGLFHTYYGGACTGSGGGCSTGGDFVCDTEPRPIIWPGPSTCFYSACVGGDPDIEYDNIMDATDENCTLEFTHGQVDRMESTLNSYYSGMFTDCNLKRSGSPCLEDLIPGPYCAGTAIQLPSVTTTAVFDKLSGAGTVSSTGSISSGQSIEDAYEVEITECGFTHLYEFSIDNCEVTADFYDTDGGCGGVNLFEDCSFHPTAYSKSFAWTFSGGWTNPTSATGPNASFGVYDQSTGTYHGSPRTVCLTASAYVYGNFVTDQYCNQVVPTCPDGQRKAKPNSQNKVRHLSISPNPSEGIFILSGMSEGPLNIKVLDISGKEILNKDSNFQEELQLDLSNLKQGVYLISVSQFGEILIAKILKK